MPQPVRTVVDAAGQAWLVLDNGHRLRIPGGGNGGSGGGGTTDNEVTIHPEQPSDGSELWLDLDAEAEPITGGGPDEVAIQTAEPVEHPDLWVDTDEPGGTGGDYVLKSGDAMNGPLGLVAPTAAEHAATKAYVDTYTDTAVVTFTSPWRDYTNRTHRLTKHAGMVTLESAFSPNSNLAISANTIVTVATLPVGYRLPAEMSFPGVLYTGPNGNPVRGWYPVGFYLPSGNGLIQFSMGTAVTMGTDGALYGNPTFRQGG